MPYLHSHTKYSFLDGYGTEEQIVKRLLEVGHPAFGITDHASIAGHSTIGAALIKNGIKPLYGCEFYITDDATKREAAFSLGIKKAQSLPHITVLAKNNKGYANLLKLVNFSWSEGYYYKPRIDHKTLYRYSDGLVVLTGCAGGYTMRQLMQGRTEDAGELLLQMKRNIEDLYVEVIPCPNDDGIVNGCVRSIDLAGEVDLPIVLTGDSHFPCIGDHKAQNTVFAVGLYTTVDKMAYEVPDYHYINTTQQLIDRCIGFEVDRSWIDNTSSIAGRCEVELPRAKWVSSGYIDIKKKIEDLAGGEHPEIELLHSKGYLDYIMIVYHIVRHVRSKGHLVVPRGSACGSHLLFLLGISTVDPKKYGLSFERFYDETRADPPDIDLDFSPEGRECALQYIQENYPYHSKIASFIEYQEKSAKADIQRCKSSVPIEAIVGQIKTTGVHAAGIIISDEPITDFVAVNHKGVALIDKHQLEYYNLQKFDLLTVNTIATLESFDVDYPSIPLDDPDVFELFNQGILAGVFQFEGKESERIVKKLGIRSFNDIIAFNALCRPAASAHIERYQRGRDSGEKAKWGLDDTYGVILYQEQVMQILRDYGKFAGGDVNKCRKMISSSNVEGLRKYKSAFLNAYTGEDAKEMWSEIEAHGGYSFNKSHGTAYAQVAYWTAWLKLKYKSKYYAVAMCHSSEEGRMKLMAEFIRFGGKIELLETLCSDFEAQGMRFIAAGVGNIVGVGERRITQIQKGLGVKFVTDRVEKLKTCGTQEKLRLTKYFMVEDIERGFQGVPSKATLQSLKPEDGVVLVKGYVTRKTKYGIMVSDGTKEMEFCCSKSKNYDVTSFKRGDFISVPVWCSGDRAYVQSELQIWKLNDQFELF